MSVLAGLEQFFRERGPLCFRDFGPYAPDQIGLFDSKAVSAEGLLHLSPLLEPWLKDFPSAQLERMALREALMALVRTHPEVHFAGLDDMANSCRTVLKHVRRLKQNPIAWRQATRWLSPDRLSQVKTLLDRATEVPWSTAGQEYLRCISPPSELPSPRSQRTPPPSELPSPALLSAKKQSPPGELSVISPTLRRLSLIHI